MMSLVGTCFEKARHSTSHEQSHLNEMLNHSIHDEDAGSYSCSAIHEDHHRTLETANHFKDVFNAQEIDTTDFVHDPKSLDNCDRNKTTMEETRESLKTEEDSCDKKQDCEQTETVAIKDGECAIHSEQEFVSSQKDAHMPKYFSKVDDRAANKSMDNWENERSLPWSRAGSDRIQNLSIPMYLFLKNSDIKSKILDLEKREQLACRGFNWDEALRLRDMKNKLSLTREHQLLNAVGLQLDEEMRIDEIKSISERQKIITEREKICSNGCLYSEDAKELWKKWEAEDEKLEKDEAFLERERLMQTLEDEWKTLASEDKIRISHLYE